MSRRGAQASRLEEAMPSDVTTIEVGGHKAYRWEMRGIRQPGTANITERSLKSCHIHDHKNSGCIAAIVEIRPLSAQEPPLVLLLQLSPYRSLASCSKVSLTAKAIRQ
jgi:hypothetical protein